MSYVFYPKKDKIPQFEDKFDGMDLSPIEVMEPYKPCWCGSGKKWKWCHKNRDRQDPINFSKLLNDMYNVSAEGVCLHPQAPNGCGEKIIRAHTVQKNRGLLAISENFHVLSVKDGIRNLKKSDSLVCPVQVGLRTASTFTGFCDIHDGSMFRPVEHGDFTLNQETAFLLSFRAVAYELFTKLSAEKWAEKQREADRGMPFQVQVDVQNTVHWTLLGTRKAINDVSQWKAEYDQAYNQKDFSKFHYVAAVFDEILPFAACGCFMPEFDFDGAVLQHLDHLDQEMDHIAFNVTTIDGKTVGIFGWHGDGKKFSRQFAQSFVNLNKFEIADALLGFAFEHIENTFLKPSWWYSLETEFQNYQLSKLKNASISVERQRTCLIPKSERLLNVTPVVIDVSYIK